jgi:DNA repair protein RadC
MVKRQQARIKTPNDVLNVISKWKNKRQENFVVVTLNGTHGVIRINHVTKGLVNRTLVHPRECFRPAIKDNAIAVIFIHNHPSGNIDPSDEDDEITNRLCMAGEILGIKVLDHIIITSGDDYYSYGENGKINKCYEVEDLEQYVAEISMK